MKEDSTDPSQVVSQIPFYKMSDLFVSDIKEIAWGLGLVAEYSLSWHVPGPGLEAQHGEKKV
jgi:hypothetical protein